MCFIVDVACPFDTRVAEKETEKIDHFKDLKVEVQLRSETAEEYLSSLL